ncbi:MAG: hypothetical protein U5J83_10780 [Bryobacterales bacterium]|nr:hypothetical protein [Bryobacterales bacterium]
MANSVFLLQAVGKGVGGNWCLVCFSGLAEGVLVDKKRGAAAL